MKVTKSRESVQRLRKPAALSKPIAEAETLACQLQEGEPLPLVNFLERLHRLECDISTMREACTGDNRDEGVPEILIEGQVLTCNDPVLWKELSDKITGCRALVLQVLETAISEHLAKEFMGEIPVREIIPPTRRLSAKEAAHAK